MCVCACVCVCVGGGGGGEITSQLTTTVGKCYLQELCCGHLSTSCHATLAKNYYSQCSVGLLWKPKSQTELWTEQVSMIS